jgi:VWFA-related protein
VTAVFLRLLVFVGASFVVATHVMMAQTARFKTGVAAIRVDALVTDGRRPVPGLTAENFELRDNGVLQQITDISHEHLALNIICVLDLSYSVAGRPLEHLKDGVTAIVDALSDKDRAALVSFANRLQLLSGLTGDRKALRGLVEKLEAGGATSVFDAAFAGLALRERDEGRTLMLLLSDGKDTSSWLPARKTLRAAQRSDVVVYPVTVRVPRYGRSTLRTSELESAMAVLDALADDTGGRVVYADSEEALRKIFTEVLSEFRQRYVLTYVPSGTSGPGWHALEVKLKGRSGQVRARRGYFAGVGEDY